MELLSRYDLIKTSALYISHQDTIGLLLIPTQMLGLIQWEKNCRPEPLVQLKLLSDKFNDGFTNGLTLRNSESARFLIFKEQAEKEGTIETIFTNKHGHTIKHFLKMLPQEDAFISCVEFTNTSQSPAVLEMLSSFAVGYLSPFDSGESELCFHRFQTYWSAEGRHKCETVEDLHLEKAWASSAVRCERYGSIGSMPVRKFFPFGGVEDRRNGVIWGAQLAHPASWQMEFAMQDDALHFSGGLADRDFGHWHKTLSPGEVFQTPLAILTVVQGDIDQLGNKLANVQRAAFLNGPEEEKTLPIAFNEFCTTWGNPTIDRIKAMADQLAGRDIRYLVIDCGWYGHVDWSTCMGDWEPDAALFPNGLKEAADYIRQKGMIPGLWFEMETVGMNAKAFHFQEHLLKRDGVTITVGSRRFWNMADPWVQNYLFKKVVTQLKEGGFGYLKVDYNNSIGVGCDGWESLGEGLRKNMEATQAFFKRIRDEIPGIVIENCSSGGHRLEPSMMALVSQASFSDAHECISIPIIAANLHRLIHPAQSQIWAVLRKKDDEERLYYSIANTFLGRMCLSGDLSALSPQQMTVIQQGITFYQKITHIILWGETKRFGPPVQSYNHPKGWQGILRQHENKAVYIVHAFGGAASIPFVKGYEVVEAYGSSHLVLDNENQTIVAAPTLMCAKAFLLKRSESSYHLPSRL